VRAFNRQIEARKSHKITKPVGEKRPNQLTCKKQRTKKRGVVWVLEDLDHLNCFLTCSQKKKGRIGTKNCGVKELKHWKINTELEVEKIWMRGSLLQDWKIAPRRAEGGELRWWTIWWRCASPNKRGSRKTHDWSEWPPARRSGHRQLRNTHSSPRGP
jgi:hypothetical protein